MPNASLSVSVDLTLYSVSCPGVFLKDRDECFVEICLFGKHSQTQSVPAMFPLFFNERFKFHKVFYNASNPLDLCAQLKEESVMIEVVQKSKYIHAGVVLASLELPAQDFLFPYPSAVPVYAGVDRELLLNRTMHFDGISPKIEFSSSTSVNSLQTSAVGELKDAVNRINNEGTLGRSYGPANGPSRRSKSLSRPKSSAGEAASGAKPPFVVRKIDQGLLKSAEPLAATVGGKKRSGRSRRKKSGGKKRSSVSFRTSNLPSSAADGGDLKYRSSSQRYADSGDEEDEDVGIEYSPEASDDEEPVTATSSAVRPYSSAPAAGRRSSDDSLIDEYIRDSDWPAVPSTYEALIEKLERKRLLYEIERESRLARLRDPVYDPRSRYYLDSLDYELELSRRRRELERDLDRLYSRLRRPLIY